MYSLVCYLFAVTVTVSSEQLSVGSTSMKKAAITNEEHIDESVQLKVYQCIIIENFGYSLFALFYVDFGYYGGDIILTEWQKELLLGRKEAHLNGKTIEMVVGDEAHDHGVDRRAVARNDNYLWLNGVVPYVLESSLSKQQ